MMEFFNSSVREEFHKLPLWRQEDLQELADSLGRKRKVLMICQIDQVSEKILEISVRIDEKFNLPSRGIMTEPA